MFFLKKILIVSILYFYTLITSTLYIYIYTSLIGKESVEHSL